MQCIRVCGRALEMHQKSREFDIQGHTLTPLGPVCICRDFVIWHGVHGADWVEAGHRAQHGHSNGVQNTLGDWCGDARVWVGSMVGGLVVAGASWGYGKKCCGVNKILPMPMLILLLPNK